MGASKGKPRAATAGSGAGSMDDGHLPPSQSYWQVSITAVTGTPAVKWVLNSWLEHHVTADLGLCSPVQQGKHPLYSQQPQFGNPEDWEVLQEPEGG